MCCFSRFGRQIVRATPHVSDDKQMKVRDANETILPILNYAYKIYFALIPLRYRNLCAPRIFVTRFASPVCSGNILSSG